jgi:hypothetical protein
MTQSILKPEPEPVDDSIVVVETEHEYLFEEVKRKVNGAK